MRHDAKATRSRAVAFAALALLLRGTAAEAASLADTAAKPASLGIAYSIAFWSIPFGQTSYDGTLSDGGYSASSHFETSGIVSLFWQATIDASATGRITGHAVSPTQYDSYYRRGSSKKERVKITFDTNAVCTFADPPYDTAKYPVTEAQKREAVDPMSAITLVLAGVKADRANPCGTVAPVFDGRRRYNIEFSYLKDEPVTVGKLFAGSAHLCQMHYRQIAGFKPKILKEGAAFPPMYADFADIPAAGAPNGHYVVALKLWSPLSWGTVSAELTVLKVPPKAL
jgi:hypothetical protein